VRATLPRGGGRIAERGEAGRRLGITTSANGCRLGRSTGAPLHRPSSGRTSGHGATAGPLREAGHGRRSRTGLMLDSISRHEVPGSRHGRCRRHRSATWPWHGRLLGALAPERGQHGGVFATDPTNASRTLLYDIDEGAWSDELLRALRCERAVLADVRALLWPLRRCLCAALGARSRGGGLAGRANQRHRRRRPAAALFGPGPGFASGWSRPLRTGRLLAGQRRSEAPTAARRLLTTVAWDLGGQAGRAARSAYCPRRIAFVSGAQSSGCATGCRHLALRGQVGPLAGSVAASRRGLTWSPPSRAWGAPGGTRARAAPSRHHPGGRARPARPGTVEAMAYQVRAMVEAMVAATGTPG